MVKYKVKKVYIAKNVKRIVKVVLLLIYVPVAKVEKFWNLLNVMKQLVIIINFKIIILANIVIIHVKHVKHKLNAIHAFLDIFLIKHQLMVLLKIALLDVKMVTSDHQIIVKNVYHNVKNVNHNLRV